MLRIYFDANEGDTVGRFDLGIQGSVKDLEPVRSELRDRLRVQLYDADGMEIEALLEFDAKSQRWMAWPLWDTLKH
jgi:hypothetical protein